jgi:hypothetical protein
MEIVFYYQVFMWEPCVDDKIRLIQSVTAY